MEYIDLRTPHTAYSHIIHVTMPLSAAADVPIYAVLQDYPVTFIFSHNLISLQYTWKLPRVPVQGNATPT